MTAIAQTTRIPDARHGAAGRSHAEYRRAVRHSRLVHLAKIVLPLLSVVIIASFFWTSFFTANLPANLKIDRSVLQNGKLVMSDPVLTGQDENGALYRLTAKRAVQDLVRPDIVSLQTIDASLPLKNGERASVSAEAATFNRKTKMVTFDKPFHITTDSGMSADLKSARFDVKAGQFVSLTPVSVDSKEGSIIADSMRMGDKGHTIEFNDRVKMTVNPSPNTGSGAKETK